MTKETSEDIVQKTTQESVQSKSTIPNIDIVLVPAGAELRAVRRGIKQADQTPSSVIAIPAGPVAVKAFMAKLVAKWEREDHNLNRNLLLIGLGGSLCTRYRAGDSLALTQIWQGFEDGQSVLPCDLELTAQISRQLQCETGVGVTCDRIITNAKEKQQLGDRYAAQAVDMEGFSLLKSLSNLACSPDYRIAAVRIISDDCLHDLPDLLQVIRSDGSMSQTGLLLSFVRRPVAAIRLILGSLRGLKTLEKSVCKLFSIME
ncbi:MAG: phosphorylase [Cyanobacteria bacterium J06621_11]